MKLTDQQVEILKDVRAHMSKSLLRSPFICVNIRQHAIRGVYWDVSLSEFKEKFPVHYWLMDAIENAIGYCGATLTDYLLRKVPGFKALNNSKKFALSDMARLAWLDRMIETRVIA